MGFCSPCSPASDGTDGADGGGGGGNLDVITLLNTCWDLIQSYRSCLKTISAMEDQSRRLQSDADHLHEQTSRHREALETKTRALADAAERARQAENSVKEEREKLKLLKEEVYSFVILSGIL